MYISSPLILTNYIAYVYCSRVLRNLVDFLKIFCEQAVLALTPLIWNTLLICAFIVVMAGSAHVGYSWKPAVKAVGCPHEVSKQAPSDKRYRRAFARFGSGWHRKERKEKKRREPATPCSITPYPDRAIWFWPLNLFNDKQKTHKNVPRYGVYECGIEAVPKSSIEFKAHFYKNIRQYSVALLNCTQCCTIEIILWNILRVARSSNIAITVVYSILSKTQWK